MKRFFGASGKRLLVEALRLQPTLECCEPAIKKLAQVSIVKQYAAGANVIIQDSDDNRLAFILSGKVSVWVKRTKVAERGHGQHIGEMSVVDPSARRSATATAIVPTTVAWIEEGAFTKIADEHPSLWRSIARELADRLRQRAALVRDKNPKPAIFIGSSTESLNVAKAIERRLTEDSVDVHLWSEGVFDASEVTIESLEQIAQRADFAVLVLASDDKLRSRRRTHSMPRDNVIFELGLFMGAIGRRRTFMIVEDNNRLRLPPDLLGFTYLRFNKKNKKAATSDINNAVTTIRSRVAELNVR